MRLVIMSLFALVSFSASAQPGRAAMLKPEAFDKAVAAGGAVILDTRTENEFRTGYIRNAMQANWNDTAQFRQRVQHIDRNQRVYVYCLAGIRSAAAAKWMRQQGFSDIIELEGGINAWKKAGMALESPVTERQLTMEDIGAMTDGPRTVLIRFGGDWCPPCRKMNPVIDSLAKDSTLNFEVVSIDASVQTDIQKIFGISVLPTFLVFKNGADTWRGEGIVTAAELKRQLK